MPVSGTFTGVGVGQSLTSDVPGEITWSISGTFVGTVIIERALGTSAWLRIDHQAPISGASSGSFAEQDPGVYRFRCTSFTSGSIAYQMQGVPSFSGASVRSVAGLTGDVSALQLLALLNATYTGVMTVAPTVTNQVFQRDTRTGGAFSLGAGAVTLTVTTTQPAARLDYRIRDASAPGTVLQDWTFASGNLGVGSLAVSISMPAALHWYLIDLRANSDDTSIVSTTNGIAVGEVVAIAGQSLALAFLTTYVTSDPATLAGLGVTASPFGVVYASYANNSGAYPPVADGVDVNYPPAGWVVPADGTSINGTGVAEFLRLAVANTGVPCAVTGYAVGGTSIASWLPGYAGANPGHWTKLVANLTAAGSKFGAIIWDQGHYEAKDGTTSGIYLAALQSLFSSITAQFPSSGAYKKLVATIPGVGAYGSGPSFIEMVRATAKQYVASDGNAVYVDGMDATLWSDLVHPSQAGNIIYARHFYRAFLASLGLRGNGDSGPVITGASRTYNSANLDLSVSQPNGGSALVQVGAVADQFIVYPSGTTSGALTISSVDTSISTRIRLVLSAAPTEPAALDVWYRLPPDTATIISHGIYDNVTDSDGLAQGRQLTLVATAITAAAPTYTLAVTVGTPPTLVNTSFGVTGTYAGGGVPAALDYSTDSGTTWTAASSPVISGGSFSFTISAGVPVGSYALMVRDHGATSTVGTAAVFTVAQASPPTLPTIANQIFAMDASNVVGVFYSDTGLTTQAVNGQGIAGIKDATSTGNNFTQATSAKRPVLQVSAKNSLPGLRFTGTSAQLLAQVAGTLSETIRQSTGYGILCIYTPATLPTAAAADVFDIGASNSSALDKVRAVQLLTAGTMRTSRNSDATLTSAVLGTAITANTLAKAVSRFDGTSIFIAANAITETTATPAGAFTTPWVEGSQIGVGTGANDVAFVFDGWVHEIRVWNTAITTTDRTNLLTYATSKWGS